MAVLARVVSRHRNGRTPQKVVNEMREGRRLRGWQMTLLAALTVLSVQGLGAAPAQALLTDTNDCPACEDSTGGAPSGGTAAEDSGIASDPAPSAGGGFGDPLALTDFSKEPNPFAATQGINIPTAPFGAAAPGTGSPRSNFGRCNTLIDNIADHESMVDSLTDAVNQTKDAIESWEDPTDHSLSLAEKDVARLRGRKALLIGIIGRQHNVIRAYRWVYRDLNCDSTYAAYASDGVF
jgi:hypothetical protein